LQYLYNKTGLRNTSLHYKKPAATKSATKVKIIVKPDPPQYSLYFS